jgi:hypothetical protein
MQDAHLLSVPTSIAPKRSGALWVVVVGLILVAVALLGFVIFGK